MLATSRKLPRPWPPPTIPVIRSSVYTDRYATSGNGDPGSSYGTTWGIGNLFYLDSLAGSPMYIQNNSDESQNGWTTWANSNNFLCSVRHATTAWTNTPAKTLVSGDIGKIHLQIVCVEAANIYHYFDRALVGSVSLPGFRPGVSKGMLLAHNLGYPCIGLGLMAHWTFTGSGTLANVQTWHDAVKTAKDVPASFSGISFRSRYSVRESRIADANLATILDSTGNGRHMAKVGNPTQGFVANSWSW